MAKGGGTHTCTDPASPKWHLHPFSRSTLDAWFGLTQPATYFPPLLCNGNQLVNSPQKSGASSLTTNWFHNLLSYSPLFQLPISLFWPPPLPHWFQSSLSLFGCWLIYILWDSYVTTVTIGIESRANSGSCAPLVPERNIDSTSPHVAFPTIY